MSETKKEETAAKVQGAKTKSAAKREEARNEPVIYIGPSIKNVASTGTVYNNGLPDALQKEMERQQVLKSLVIPVSGLADAQREINTPGSAMNLIYGKVKTK